MAICYWRATTSFRAIPCECSSALISETGCSRHGIRGSGAARRCSQGLTRALFTLRRSCSRVVSPHVAWVIGEIFIFSSIGVGTCLFLYDSGTSPIASFLGAAVFAFGGAVLTQASVHTDMAEGLASLPWVLLAIRRIGVDGRWRWCVLLGLAFALTIVAGSPEAMLDTALLGLTYGLLRWSVQHDIWRRLVTRGALAAVIAVGLSATVWLPAMHFISVSQRADASESFASAFAFPLPGGLLGLIPYLEGGSSMFSQPVYFGRSNLGELGFYIGILPVIAVLSMLGPRWRDKLPTGERRCWYGVMVVGLILAIGAGTPLEHVLYRIPLYGSQRDSGRNIVDVDFAASALFAWWIDRGDLVSRARHSIRDLLVFVPFALVALTGVLFALFAIDLMDGGKSLPPAFFGGRHHMAGHRSRGFSERLSGSHRIASCSSRAPQMAQCRCSVRVR